MAAYELLLLNTSIPQIQAAQSGDTYVVPRDIAFNAGVNVANNDMTVYGLTIGRGAGAVGSNTVVGSTALTANTTGVQNTATGYLALQNFVASYNTAYGAYALTGVGAGASTGQFNVAVGTGAGNAITTGSGNTFIGMYAGVLNQTGDGNIAIGGNGSRGTLGSNTTGSYNTAVGLQALGLNSTASSNTAVGFQAGYTNQTGSNNTSVGYGALYLSTATGNTVIGSQAGDALTTGGFNTMVGYLAGTNAQGGTYNTFVGVGSGLNITSGAKNTILGCYDGNQGGLDIRTANNHIVLSDGDGNPRLYINNGGSFFCIGIYNLTTANAANVYVDGNGTLYRSTSALKYKQDIRDLESLDITKLRPVRYKSKGELDDQTKDHFGVIADEAADAGFEELVTRGADGEVEGFQYERLTVVLLKELQTLRARVAQLEGKGA